MSDMDNRQRKQVETLRKAVRRKRLQGSRGDASQLTVSSSDDSDSATSNEIHIGGIADFHERLEPALDFLRKMSRTIVDEDYQTTFYIYRTDNNQVLARGITGFDAAKKRASELRKRYGLKFDQVKFKSQGRSTSSSSSSGSRMDVAKTYNPSKRAYFRGRYDADGSYHDID